MNSSRVTNKFNIDEAHYIVTWKSNNFDEVLEAITKTKHSIDLTLITQDGKELTIKIDNGIEKAPILTMKHGDSLKCNGSYIVLTNNGGFHDIGIRHFGTFDTIR